MDELHKVIQGEVESTDAIRDKYSHDASIFEVRPEAVIYPKDIHDVQQLIRYATERRSKGVNVSLTARNGGTCMSGGPLTESYVVDMTRHINFIDEADTVARTINVQAGAMHIDLEQATHPKQLLFAPYTSSRDICGIGGMLGNNASGEKSVKYGPTSKNVESVRVACADGEIHEFRPLTVVEVEQKKQLQTFEGALYRGVTSLIEANWHLIDHSHPRTVKNAAGYPLWELWDAQRSHFNLGRLFIGSQGTLGIITDTTLKLVPMAEFSRMIVIPIEKIEQLTSVVRTAMAHHPVTCETFDHHTYDLAVQYHPEDAARASLAKGQHMVVMVVFEGDSQSHVDHIAQAAKADIEKLGRSATWIQDQPVADSFLLIRRKSFRMLLEHPHKDMRAMAFIEDTIVPLELYGEFLAALEAILASYVMQYTYAGHIGDGSIRLVPLVNMAIDTAPEKIMELETRVNDLVVAMGGSISADHNDGIIRTPYLPQFFGEEMYGLFEQVKKIFDPHGIFNPGKKVGGSFEYALKHIVRGN